MAAMRADHDAFPFDAVQPAGKRLKDLIVPAAIRAGASRRVTYLRER
jgi:hypothetical protein